MKWSEVEMGKGSRYGEAAFGSDFTVNLFLFTWTLRDLNASSSDARSCSDKLSCAYKAIHKTLNFLILLTLF